MNQIIDWDVVKTNEDYRRQVFADVFIEYWQSILHYCAQRVSDLFAEDVAKEVFVIAWRKWPQFEPRQPIEHWLLTIAKNECRRMYRIASRHPKGPGCPPERPLQPRKPADAEGRRTRLEEALNQLREMDRLILLLRYQRELSIADIADLSGASTLAVKRRLARARDRLRRKLQIR